MTLEEFCERFNPGFFAYLEKRTERYGKFTQHGPIRSAIAQVIELARSGKRLRPYLAYLSYRAHGGEEDDRIWPVLYAVELFHTFCLVHDDIIDEDDLRRNVATVHAHVRGLYASHGRAEVIGRAANAQALLVGDLVFAWVFELLAPFMGQPQFVQEFMYTVDEVVIGQMIDVDLMASPHATRELILEKMRLKTAGYTFIQPLRIGRLLAGFEEHDATLDAIGLSLGLAFQMQDDLLDIYSSEATLGKNIGSDIEEGQHTLLTQHVIDAGAPDDVRELHVLTGQVVDDDRLHLLRGLFERTGATKELEKDIAHEIHRAQELVATLSWDTSTKSALETLVSYVAGRTS